VFEKTDSCKKGIHFGFLEWTLVVTFPPSNNRRQSRWDQTTWGESLTSQCGLWRRCFVLLGSVLAVLPDECVTGLGDEMEWGVRREQQRGEVYPVRLALAYINLYQPSASVPSCPHVELHVHLQPADSSAAART
jgi:hypothetical protein